MYTFSNYNRQARKTRKEGMTKESKLLESIMGLVGETGEVVDLVKKHLFQGHKLDRKHIAEEIGDVLWYLDYLANSIGTNLEELAKSNIQKLSKRYPKGFEAERSVNRNA